MGFDGGSVDGREQTTTTDGAELRVTWLGHATVLVALDGVRLLTDPVFRGWIAHIRRVAPVPDEAALEGIDAVLLSHLHYDHLDLPSLRRLGRDVHIVAPAGSGKFLRRAGLVRVSELRVGEEVRIGPVTIVATEADHDPRRSLFGAEAPAIGYLIRGSARVYFAGDTDLFDGMEALAEGLDVALLPVSGWGPRLPQGHLDPKSAARALRLLRPKAAIPIHWGTYRRIGLERAPEALREPAESFARHAGELAPEVDVRILPVGGSFELEALAGARS
jgi:L-ascorbate metabolism protein UlaG (beta-lactamase superfamily)